MRTLLLVDDEPSIRLTLPLVIAEHGFQVSVADSVASALNQMAMHTFDVLVSDLNIGSPRDGLSVVAAARNTNPGCVAVVLTGYPDDESKAQSLKSGADAYLIKPADIEMLIATIQERQQMHHI